MKNTEQRATRIEPLIQDEILSSALPPVRTTFVCESCDYRWDVEVSTTVEDSYNDGQELRRADTHISCPICGSHETNPYED